MSEHAEEEMPVTLSDGTTISIPSQYANHCLVIEWFWACGHRILEGPEQTQKYTYEKQPNHPQTCLERGCKLYQAQSFYIYTCGITDCDDFLETE